MKANYNRKPKNVRERAVAFRTKNKILCLIQNTIYERLQDDKDIVYLDFENDEQIDKLINTLQGMKKQTYQGDEGTANDNKTES